jgi:hypothetical protein
MRNVITTNSSPDVSDEYAEEVDRLLEKLHPERETTQVNQWGQTAFYLRLYTYEAPGTGETMWAVDYNDPASRELEEIASHAEAVAHYEESVRFAAGNLGIDDDGCQERFTTTDVAGVPGPLPELPEVTADQVENLLNQSGTPVLYLARTEEGEGDDLVVEIGQAAKVEGARVVLTRSQVLTELGLDDDAVRVTSFSAAGLVDSYGVLIGYLAHKADEAAKFAADSLFPVPAS